MRIEREIFVEEGQRFQIDRFRPTDAEGIANLFFSVYGPDYPFDTYYFPGRIREENEKGNIHSVVARTPKGDIVGHGALYRSSPHNGNLYEGGQYMVLKNYRNTSAIYRINKYIGETLMPGVGLDGVFGEAVCYHVTAQKASALIGLKDVALEVDLMPSESYQREKSAPGRVSCLVQFRSLRDRPHQVFVPPVYLEQIEYIQSDCDISRVITPAAGTAPADSKTGATVKFFSHAGVARVNVVQAGADFGSLAAEVERQAGEQAVVVLQFFLNLDKPWAGCAVEHLRDRGYFLGGYVPRWFDTDGLLMQKVLSEPGFDNIALHSEKAKKIKEQVQADWDRARTKK